MRPVLVSVVLPVLNGADVVSHAVQDILAQTHQDLELIVVDDGSTDATPSVLASVDDARLVVVRQQQRGGVARALNAGISKAKGSLIGRMDADDRSDERRIERLVAYFEEDPSVGVVGTDAWFEDVRTGIRRLWSPPHTDVLLQRHLINLCYLVHGSIVMRRDLFDLVGGYRPATEPAEDYDLWLRLSEVARVKVIPEPLYTYRFHDESQSSRRATDQETAAKLAVDGAVLRRSGKADHLGRRLDVVTAQRTLGRLGALRHHWQWTRRLARRGRVKDALRVLAFGAGSVFTRS